MTNDQMQSLLTRLMIQAGSRALEAENREYVDLYSPRVQQRKELGTAQMEFLLELNELLKLDKVLEDA